MYRLRLCRFGGETQANSRLSGSGVAGWFTQPLIQIDPDPSMDKEMFCDHKMKWILGMSTFNDRGQSTMRGRARVPVRIEPILGENRLVSPIRCEVMS
jgi:hypothetical protein